MHICDMYDMYIQVLSKMQTNRRSKYQTAPQDTHIIVLAQDIK
jgi:hypothetical protein